MQMHEFNVFIYLAERLGYSSKIDIFWLAAVTSAFVVIIIAIFSLIVWAGLRRTGKSLVPSGRFSAQNVIEVSIEWLVSVMERMLGPRAERFLPLIGALFIYIFCCNILGVIPGFFPPTAVITTNLACALVVFLYYNAVGLKDLGPRRYLRQFLGPVIWMAPLFVFIELATHFARPISLSIRLYGNMMGEELVMGMFSKMAPIVVPIFFIILGAFVALIQAFVFAILSTVYIALATQDE